MKFPRLTIIEWLVVIAIVALSFSFLEPRRSYHGSAGDRAIIRDLLSLSVTKVQAANGIGGEAALGETMRESMQHTAWLSERGSLYINLNDEYWRKDIVFASPGKDKAAAIWLPTEGKRVVIWFNGGYIETANFEESLAVARWDKNDVYRHVLKHRR